MTWSMNFKDVVKNVIEDLEFTIQDATAETFANVVMRSPVDTGLFRGNWECTLGDPTEDTRQVFDKSGAIGTAEAYKAQTFPIGKTVYFSNNLHYGEGLEFYSVSNQAPHGMVRISAAEWEQNIAKAVRK